MPAEIFTAVWAVIFGFGSALSSVIAMLHVLNGTWREGSDDAGEAALYAAVAFLLWTWTP